MTLTYHKAVVAAVLEQSPTKPMFPKDFPWRLRLDALRRYRDALARWKRIGDALAGQHVSYLPIQNTPSSMCGMHGAGTLRKPLPAHTIVHTGPNHATRRRNGELGQARQNEIERQQEDIRAAREAIAHSTWGLTRSKEATTYYGATADQFIYDEVA